MKYKQEIIINAPLKKVVKLFEDPEALKYAHPTLISHTQMSGTPGKVGAKSVMKFKSGKSEFDLIETITKRDLPREFVGFYEMNEMNNVMSNKFESIDTNTTKYIIEIEYVFKKFMPKLFAILMPWMFKKQSYDFLKRFKEFVEKN